MRNGRLVGGILMGEISKAAYLMQAFDRDAPLPEERLALLFDIGAPPQAVTLAEMPLEMQVCNCNGVSKGAIGACVASGRRDLRSVMTATKAGMGCGSCKSQVDALVTFFLDQAPALAPEPELALEQPTRLDGHVQARILDDGTFSMTSDTADGHCTPAQLMRIAEVALKYNVPSVKLFGQDRVDLVGVARDDLPKIWSELYLTAAE